MVAAAKLKARETGRSSGFVQTVKKIRPNNKLVQVYKIKNRDSEESLSARAREELILKYQIKARKMAFSILRRWHARLDLQEVHSLVDLSLCEAVRRYNPAKGASFLTFLFYHLKGNLIRAVTAAARLTAIPFSELEYHAGQSEAETASRNEWRTVTAMEVADAVSSRENLLPDEIVIRKELLRVSLEACRCLDALEKEVLFRIYLQEEQLLDVAVSLGYSRCHISRVKRRALETLQNDVMSKVAEAAAKSLESTGHRITPLELRIEKRRIFRRKPRSEASRARKEAIAARKRLEVIPGRAERLCA